jgi:hypothetical protein
VGRVSSTGRWAAGTDGLRAAHGVPDDLTYETEVQVKLPEAIDRDRPGVLADPWSNRPSPPSDTGVDQDFYARGGPGRSLGPVSILQSFSSFFQILQWDPRGGG